MTLNMEADMEAQKDEIDLLHMEIEELKQQLTTQVSENDVLKEKEIILQNQNEKITQDMKAYHMDIEVRNYDN